MDARADRRAGCCWAVIPRAVKKRVGSSARIQAKAVVGWVWRQPARPSACGNAPWRTNVLVVGRFGGERCGARHAPDAKHTQPTDPGRRTVHLFDYSLCYDRNTDLFSMSFGMTRSGALMSRPSNAPLWKVCEFLISSNALKILRVQITSSSDTQRSPSIPRRSCRW